MCNSNLAESSTYDLTAFSPVTLKIRELNDLYRKTSDEKIGQTVLTRSVADMDIADRENIVSLTRNFDSFNEENDPHGEHDFFSFEYLGVKFMAKFDYYDKTLKHGTEFPEDPDRCTRVLTIMCASDW